MPLTKEEKAARERERYARKETEIHTRDCVECGLRFYTPYPSHLCCSDTCRNRRERRAKVEVARALVDAAKAQGCVDCGVIYPSYVMDMDHVCDPSEKVADISRLVGAGKAAAVRRELLKCEPVCSNCHRIRTHARRLGQRGA